jgi:signal transduction histidine kinase
MIYSLRTKWILSILLTSLVGVGLVGLFTSQTNTQELDQLVADKALTEYVTEVTAFYEEARSWRSAAAYFDPNRVPGEAGRPMPPPGTPPPGSQPPSGPPQPDRLPQVFRARPAERVGGPDFIIANADRYIVKPALGYGINTLLTDDEMARARPVVVDGETVGYVMLTQGGTRLSEREQGFLQRTTQATLVAMLVAGVLAALVGTFVANRVLAPLHELNRAIEGMRDGKLNQQIPVRGRDEISRLAEAFNMMSSQLARNQEMQRQMTSDIAHDLRTPLTVISGYLEALRDGTFAPTEARINTMFNEAQALQFLVSDLNTLSRADHGRLRLNTEPTAPRDLVERVKLAFELQAQNKQIQLRVEIAEDLPLVPMDMERMAQVMGNLISNALRYTPAHGAIAISAHQHGDQLRLTVRDTGSGIPPEKLPYIFERFYRADEARYQIGHESGLGLAIARSLVEAHGGSISASSEVGVGTTFVIDIPLAGQEVSNH